jgi:hypothetical protein
MVGRVAGATHPLLFGSERVSGVAHGWRASARAIAAALRHGLID